MIQKQSYDSLVQKFYLEGGVEQLVVGLRLGEPQVLLLSPDVYVASVLGANARA